MNTTSLVLAGLCPRCLQRVVRHLTLLGDSVRFSVWPVLVSVVIGLGFSVMRLSGFGLLCLKMCGVVLRSVSIDLATGLEMTVSVVVSVLVLVLLRLATVICALCLIWCIGRL